MTSHSGSTPIQLQVNLAIVRGHYADAVPPHLRGRARAAQFAAIRDIPVLISEIDRLWILLTEAWIRYASLRAAALATMAAHEADGTDRFSRLREELSADGQRGRSPGRARLNGRQRMH
jgi:hypothetical protein